MPECVCVIRGSREVGVRGGGGGRGAAMPENLIRSGLRPSHSNVEWRSI